MEQIENKVIAIISEITEQKNDFYDKNKNIKDYGIDSLGMVNLVMEIENSFNINFSYSNLEISNFDTISNISKMIQRKINE